MPIEPGHEHHAGFVEAGRGLEDVPRERHGRLQDGVKAGLVTAGKLAQRGAGGRGDGIKNAQQRVALGDVSCACRAKPIAGNQLGVVEIIARVHAHATHCIGGQAPAHGDFPVFVQQRNLDAIDLVGVCVDDVQRGLHGGVDIGAAPVAFERRVEHVAQPVQDDGLARLAQDAVVDAFVIGGRFGHPGQGAAGHHNQFAAKLFDGFHLQLVGGNHFIDRFDIVQVQVIGAAAAGREGPGEVLLRLQRAADQFERGGPIQAHAALGGVHAFGYAQAQRPQVAAVGNRRVPIDRALQPRVYRGQRVGHHVGGAVRDAVEGGARAARATSATRSKWRTAQGVGLNSASEVGQQEIFWHVKGAKRNGPKSRIYLFGELFSKK